MLEAVRALGNNLKSDKNSLADYLSIARLEKTKIILSIVIERESYVQIKPEEKKPEYIERYLYSAGPPNGADRTPASLLTEPEKTFKKKILKWFEKYGMVDNDLENIGKILNRNTEKIVLDLKKEIENLPKEHRNNVLLTVKTRKEGEREKFLGEDKSVRQILNTQFKVNNKKNVIPISCRCIFCADLKPIITDRSPISDIFSFSTPDKRGFLYSFAKSSIYKQLPVCTDCYLDLKRGKDWLDRYAYFGFEGYKYYVIPDVVASLENQNEGRLTEFKNNAELYSKEQDRADKMPLRYENNLMQYERDLLEYIAEKGLDFSLLFIFISLKGGGKFMDVEKYIEDVPTTWIKKIFDEYNAVLNMPIFNEASMRSIISQKWDGGLKDKKEQMYLAILVRQFFPLDATDIKFLDMISKLLNGSKTSSDVLIKAFLRPIRLRVYDNWDEAKFLTLKSLALFLTMIKLQLIKDIMYIKTMSDNSKDTSPNIEEILDSELKKAVFLEGVLAGKLLAIQYARRKSTPFLEKLHSLHISFSEAKRLLPKIVGKLREYQSTYTEIEKNAANQFLLSDKSDKELTDDESSYYFTLGMLLHSSVEKQA